MIKYRIITGTSVGYVEEKVNESLEDGWYLRGELVVIHDFPGTRYTQAMTWMDNGYPPVKTQGQI